MREADEAWWRENEPSWKRDPAYYENLRSKAEQYGKAWVRENKRMIDAYFRNAGSHVEAHRWVEEHGSLDDW